MVKHYREARGFITLHKSLMLVASEEVALQGWDLTHLSWKESVCWTQRMLSSSLGELGENWVWGWGYCQRDQLFKQFCPPLLHLPQSLCFVMQENQCLSWNEIMLKPDLWEGPLHLCRIWLPLSFLFCVITYPVELFHWQSNIWINTKEAFKSTN